MTQYLKQISHATGRCQSKDTNRRLSHLVEAFFHTIPLQFNNSQPTWVSAAGR